MMEIDEPEPPPLPPSWFEFILDRSFLIRHLSTENSDPSPTTLLSQFVINGEKAANDEAIAAAAVAAKHGEDDEELDAEETLILAYRQKKLRALRLISLQTAAYLNWDLDALSKVHISTQYAFMKHLLQAAFFEPEEPTEVANSKEFLRVLYHRWVLRTFQSNNSSKTLRNGQQAEQVLALEAVWKELSQDDSLGYLNSSLSKPELASATHILVPSAQTFAVDNSPDWSVGERIDKSAFESMIHLELGIFLLHKGASGESVVHFQNQRIPLENFPYLNITKAKLEGYLRAVGLLTTFDQAIEDSKVIPRSLNHERMLELSLSIRKGLNPSVRKLLDGVKLDSSLSREKGRLDPERRDNEDGSYIIPGDDKLSLFSLEKRLIETTDEKELEDCIKKLLAADSLQQPPRSLSTIFSEWELPIPVQHAVKSLSGSGGMFQDHIYILVAKSRQLLNCKKYSHARQMLKIAKEKLSSKFQQVYQGGINPYVCSLDRLITMMDWEILLLDITQFTAEYPDGVDNSKLVDLKSRCRQCLERLQDPKSEVNPRSEIVENILVAYINLGEYSFVSNFDKSQNQRWPFVEFIALLAKVCHDLFMERKETSSSYRELWSAVLPIFTNNSSGSSSNSKKPSTMSNKPSMLSSRTSLAWVIDRSCSQPLLSVWVSLLARLHNHILDEVGLQIHADFLHIWPNILDDVTASNSSIIPELKPNRVSGSSKLNAKNIRDFLFSLLERACDISRGGESGVWLRCLGDVQLASGSPSLAMKCYIEYLAMATDFFEKSNAPHWNDNTIWKRMIKCCEMLGCFTQAVVLCQFLSPKGDYSIAFGMAQEKTTNDSSDSLYGFIFDLTILEFLISLHTKRNETTKRQQAVKIMGLLELNSNNNEEIQREAMCLRRSQFMRTLAKHYIFV